MTHLRRTSALLFGALLALSLTSLPDTAQAEDPTVTLQDAGKGKKAPLRMSPKIGVKESMTMSIEMGLEMTMGELQIPAQDPPVMTMVMDTEVNEILKDGTFTYTFKFTKAESGASDSLPPAALEEMNKTLGQMVGMEGHGTVTPRGFSRDGAFVLPEGVAPELQETLDNMSHSMDQMVAPLPEEPVGIGAKWTVVSKPEANGMKIDQTAHYTLLSREDDAIELSVRLEQTAAKQTVDLGAQGSFELVRYTGAGTGSTKLNLGRVAPIEALVEMTSDVGMNMDMGGQAVEMGVVTEVKNTMTGTLRE